VAVKRERHRRQNAQDRRDVVPPRRRTEIEVGKQAEDHEGDYLLNYFELVGGELAVASAVRRDLKTYSPSAISQLSRIAQLIGNLGNFRWPYQAKVMNVLETHSSSMVLILPPGKSVSLPRRPGLAQRVSCVHWLTNTARDTLHPF